MGPVVEAAWIAGASGVLGVLVGVTGTAIVGIAGFRNIRNATTQSITAARDDRLYDRRAEVYVDHLGALAWAQGSRQAWMMDLGDLKPPAQIKQMLDSIEQPNWHLLEARIQAFGTVEAFTAVQSTSTANLRAASAYASWHASRRPQAGKQAVLDAILAADAVSDSFVELVRRELLGDGAPLRDWQPPGMELCADQA